VGAGVEVGEEEAEVGKGEGVGVGERVGMYAFWSGIALGLGAFKIGAKFTTPNVESFLKS
jgi:hypothetical protein